MKNPRPTWDQYFINIAKDVSERATCLRAMVGAVIVKDNHILSTGYNGAPSGETHCITDGCLMVNGHCERTIHAETNAVVQSARFGVPIDGATLYFWDSMNREADSCTKCFQVMKMAGIKRIVNKNGKEILL
jgi:dCMP deaminase